MLPRAAEVLEGGRWRRLTTRSVFAGSAAAVALCIAMDAWVPGLVARAMGYRGTMSMFVLDVNVWSTQTALLLTAYGPAGRGAVALTHLTFDLLLPLVLTVFLLDLLVHAGRYTGVRVPPALLGIPLAAGLADLLENVGIVALATTSASNAIASATTLFTVAKFVLIGASAGVALAWLGGAGGPTRTVGRRAVVAVVAALTAATSIGLAAFAGDADPGASDLPRPPCAALLTIGLRGNGDTVDSDEGMGGDAKVFVHRIADRLPSIVGAAAVGFPYVTGPPPQVVSHVRAGSRLLATYVAERSRRCPGERLVLVGQSEGAAVVHLALPFVGGQLVAAVLVADPARLAGTAYDDLGSANDGLLAGVLLGGIGALGRQVPDVLPPSLAASVRSYCLATDPVCDANPATELEGRQRGIHTSYRNNPGGIVDRAAAFVGSRI